MKQFAEIVNTIMRECLVLKTKFMNGQWKFELA